MEKPNEGKLIFRRFSKRLRGTHGGWSLCLENSQVAKGNIMRVSLYLKKNL
jgi:hypothetical protein